MANLIVGATRRREPHILPAAIDARIDLLKTSTARASSTVANLLRRTKIDF
jgi:hypothetical protein